MPRREIPDRYLLLDLYYATNPSSDEHRLTINVNFTDYESKRIKAAGASYISEAYDTVKNLLLDRHGQNPATDLVIVVEGIERNKRKSKYSQADDGKNLHCHGLIRCLKTFTAKDLKQRVNSKNGGKMEPTRGFFTRDFNPLRNYDYIDEYVNEDCYLPRSSGQRKYVFNVADHPVDIGWLHYMSKEFEFRPPKGCEPPLRRFSASKQTKHDAKKLRERRSKSYEAMVRWMFDDPQGSWRDLHLRRGSKSIKPLWSEFHTGVLGGVKGIKAGSRLARSLAIYRRRKSITKL